MAPADVLGVFLGVVLGVGNDDVCAGDEVAQLRVVVFGEDFGVAVFGGAAGSADRVAEAILALLE